MCAGDTDAYAHLVDRHAPMAIRTAAVLGAGADAEDVVQEAFVKAYAALGSLREGAPFRPWFLQDRRQRDPQPAPGRRPAFGAGTTCLGAGRAARCAPGPTTRPRTCSPRSGTRSSSRGLAQLSPAHREVVSCRYLLDLDEAETAAVLGWPRGTVKSRLHRALRRLQSNLGDVPTIEGADAP